MALGVSQAIGQVMARTRRKSFLDRSHVRILPSDPGDEEPLIYRPGTVQLLGEDLITYTWSIIPAHVHATTLRALERYKLIEVRDVISIWDKTMRSWRLTPRGREVRDYLHRRAAKGYL